MNLIKLRVWYSATLLGTSRAPASPTLASNCNWLKTINTGCLLELAKTINK